MSWKKVARCFLQILKQNQTLLSSTWLCVAIFSISLENLKLLARGVADLKNNAKLLSTLPVGATYHQLRCTVGGAAAIVLFFLIGLLSDWFKGGAEGSPISRARTRRSACSVEYLE